MFGLKFRQLFFLLVMAVVVFAAIQFLPVFQRTYQFADRVQGAVKFAVSTRKSMDQVRSEIILAAKEFEIPIDPRDIHITRRGPAFTVEIDYTVPVDFRFDTVTWPRHVTASGEIFDK